MDKNHTELSQLVLQKRSLERRIDQRVRAALHRAGASLAAVTLSRDAEAAALANLSVISDAEAAALANLSVISDGYARGATNIVQLIDAQTQAQTAQLASAGALYAYLLDGVEVERAAGRLPTENDEGARQLLRRLSGPAAAPSRGAPPPAVAPAPTAPAPAAASSRAAPALCEVVPQLPALLSRIVERLLSKAPEDRYQSAFGLAADLERLRREGPSARFELGESDDPEHFELATGPYGRAAELARLEQAVAATVRGDGPVTCLVAGYSGVGKSALVEAASGSLVEQSFRTCVRLRLPRSGPT